MLPGTPQVRKSPSLTQGFGKKAPFQRVKMAKKGCHSLFRPVHMYKKYILKKNWVKTAIPALSSGRNNLPPPIWGCHRQLDDKHRNPNLNNKDHLVGQLTVKELEHTVGPTKQSINSCPTLYMKKMPNSVYEATVMDADSGLGGKFSDESGNFFTISSYNQIHRKESRCNAKLFHLVLSRGKFRIPKYIKL